MIKRILLTVFPALWLSVAAFTQNEARLLRFPAIHGNQLVFTYAGNLYTVQSEGGFARQLTSHIGYEMFPRFSPNGKHIAFTGQYDGNTEVFLIPSIGGEPKRLTHTATLERDDLGDRMGPNNIVMAWTPDGKHITYRSRKRSFNDFKGQLFNVPVEGGKSEVLPLAKGGFLSYSMDGRRIAYNMVFREFRTWKYYSGGMADDVWIFDFDTKKNTNITNNEAQDIIPMFYRDEIFFISDRDRTMNLFVYNLSTKQTTKLTHFTEFDIKFPSLGGNYIVFENGGYIYKYDLNTRSHERVPIFITGDFVHARNELKDASKNVRQAHLSPNGERIVLSARGEVFNLPAKKGITLNMTQTSGVHERNAQWSPDGKSIAWISDKTGEFEIYIASQDGKGEPVQLTKNSDTYIFGFQWSPDSRKILYSDKRMRLNLINIETGVVTIVASSGLGQFFNYAWSPDSRWITYERPERGMDIIVLYNVESKKTWDVTDGWYAASNPSFSSDGKYLVFTSRRDFNPIYSQTEWNHAYVNMSRIYMAILSKDTPSPFAPENDAVKLEKPPAAPVVTPPVRTPRGRNQPVEQPVGNVMKVDPEGIQNRIVSLPIKPSNYFNMTAVDGKIFYNQRLAPAGPMNLKIFDLKTEKETELGEDMNFAISANNKKMLVRQNNKFAVIDLPSAKIILTETVDLSNMKVNVDFAEEWQQMFDESWRQMRDFFYDPNMHGVDWEAMYNKYNVLVPYVKHRSDLAYIKGELLGELNVSHAYVVNGERDEPARIKTGLLGAQLSRHETGFFRIDKILEGANWSSDLRSPLTDIGLNVKEGDFILAVNGTPVNQKSDIYKLLVNTAGDQVELTIGSKPELAGSRQIIVVPIADESNLYYYNWVKDNIRKVSEATNGQVGYIHIPDMGVPGLNQFARLYYPQLNKKGLIIDVRGNGGGNVSPMIIERLQRTMTYATMSTGAVEGNVNPTGTHVGPKVSLIDRYSASDGDLFAYRFRHNRLGTIIGEKTWGGVIGITGGIPLIDGGFINIPFFAPYAADGSGFMIEGEGVEPDIWIANDPHREFIGIDDQLNKAIEVILKDIEQFIRWVPPIPAFPDKSK